MACSVVNFTVTFTFTEIITVSIISVNQFTCLFHGNSTLICHLLNTFILVQSGLRKSHIEES